MIFAMSSLHPRRLLAPWPHILLLRGAIQLRLRPEVISSWEVVLSHTTRSRRRIFCARPTTSCWCLDLNARFVVNILVLRHTGPNWRLRSSHCVLFHHWLWNNFHPRCQGSRSLRLASVLRVPALFLPHTPALRGAYANSPPSLCRYLRSC